VIYVNEHFAHLCILCAYVLAVVAEIVWHVDLWFFSARRWWNFAINSHLSVIQDRRMRCQWQFAAARAHDIVQYIDAYRCCLTVGSRYATQAQKVFNGIYSCCQMLLLKTFLVHNVVFVSMSFSGLRLPIVGFNIIYLAFAHDVVFNFMFVPHVIF